ncbi:MAG: hypothetical protein ABFD18_20280 [Syntrophomonas sp.]
MFVVEGLSQRAIAKGLGISRNTVRRYCQGENVHWERKSGPLASRVVTPEVLEFIKSCFEVDANSPDKRQKHTAQHIYDRLCDEKAFAGGASTIRRVVNLLQEKMPKVYVHLVFDPGEAIQVDWGTGTIILNGVKTEAHLYSYLPSSLVKLFKDRFYVLPINEWAQELRKAFTCSLQAI